jgi:hypothetical protein
VCVHSQRERENKGGKEQVREHQPGEMLILNDVDISRRIAIEDGPQKKNGGTLFYIYIYIKNFTATADINTLHVYSHEIEKKKNYLNVFFFFLFF